MLPGPSSQTRFPYVPSSKLSLDPFVHSLMHCPVSLLLLLHITLLCRYTPITRLDTGRRRRNRHGLMSSILHFLTVNTRRRARIVDTSAYLVASLYVHIFDVES